MIWFSLFLLWLIAVGAFGYAMLSEDRIRWLAGQRGIPEPGLILIAIAGGAGGMLAVLLDGRFAPARRRLRRWVRGMALIDILALAVLGWLAIHEA